MLKEQTTFSNEVLTSMKTLHNNFALTIIVYDYDQVYIASNLHGILRTSDKHEQKPILQVSSNIGHVLV